MSIDFYAFITSWLSIQHRYVWERLSISVWQEGLVEYNEENLQRADNLIKKLKANMGGTDLLPPLKHVYEQCDKMSKKGNIVQIFLITDGEISDAETVFKLVSKNRSKNRIFR